MVAYASRREHGIFGDVGKNVYAKKREKSLDDEQYNKCSEHFTRATEIGNSRYEPGPGCIGKFGRRIGTYKLAEKRSDNDDQKSRDHK